MDCAAIGVKQLNSAGENTHVDKQSSPDEIRVWEYPHYPNKINIYKTFSNIIDAHIKLHRVDSSHSRIQRIFTKYWSLAYEVNIPTLES